MKTREENKRKTFNEKLLEVQKPFLEKVSGRRRQYLTVNPGSPHYSKKIKYVI
jgi:hypothetical protein